MTLITAGRLRQFAPKGKPEILAALAAGAAAIEAGGITTPLRVQHFLSEIATETGGFSAISESLNYSVKGLRATFGSHRISDADCAKFGRSAAHAANQNAIANIVYGGAWGKKNLGNTEPGDGWRYRGGGMLQTTGRANYKKAGHEADPEALRNPDTALASALQYWAMRKINVLADADDVVAVRKAINGGTNGLEEARLFLLKAKRVFV